MKVTKLDSQAPVFRPYSLVIEVKSPQDEQSLTALFGRDQSIPDEVARAERLSCVQQEDLSNMFSSCYKFLTGAN